MYLPVLRTDRWASLASSMIPNSRSPAIRPKLNNPLAFVLSGWKHRDLVLRLARRRIETRYRGAALGVLWVWIHPLLMLAVYAFVFGAVFQSRWPLAQATDAPFALVLFSGLILYATFSECVVEAPGLMLANQVHIKQMQFPIEILPWVSFAGALFGFTVNAGLLLVFYVLLVGLPPGTALLAPLYLLPLSLWTLGVVWLLSSGGVYLRDLAQVAAVLTTALLFLSPIFYSAEQIPEALRPYYALNPLVPIVEGFRSVLFYGRVPSSPAILVTTFLGWGAAWLGYLGFMKTKKGFADVL